MKTLNPLCENLVVALNKDIISTGRPPYCSKMVLKPIVKRCFSDD